MPEFDTNKDGKVTLKEYHSTAYGEVEGKEKVIIKLSLG